MQSENDNQHRSGLEQMQCGVVLSTLFVKKHLLHHRPENIDETNEINLNQVMLSFQKKTKALFVTNIVIHVGMRMVNKKMLSDIFKFQQLMKETFYD